MPDDSDSSPQPQRSWFDRISHVLSGEPRNRDELLQELRTAHENGLLSADTLTMIQGAIRVADLQVGDVMVPRSQMIALSANTKFLELMKQVVASGHSRFPIHGDDKDQILGILLAKDLLRGIVADNASGSIRELLRPAVLIPKSKRLNDLLREFRLARNHMAIVVDEYGGVAGLVTIEDVLEQIVGKIDDEHDDAPEDPERIAAQADGQFVIDALTPIADFNERFGAEFSDEDYDTIAGLVTAALGHLPEPGEQLTLGRFNFRVAHADARRVRAFHLNILTPVE